MKYCVPKTQADITAIMCSQAVLHISWKARMKAGCFMERMKKAGIC